MTVRNAGHATLRGNAPDEGALPAGTAVAGAAAGTGTLAFAAVQAIAAALVATPLLAQPPQATPLPRNVEEPAVLPTADAASPSAGVEVLTIDTRPTGVDLGMHRHSERRDARALAPIHLQRDTGGIASAAPGAASGAAAPDAASPAAAPDASASAGAPAAAASAGAPAAAAPPAGPAAATALPDGRSQDAPAATADALDAPLSAASMNLDAVTAAAAAEASRNRNGTMVEGRIVAPR